MPITYEEWKEKVNNGLKYPNSEYKFDQHVQYDIASPISGILISTGYKEYGKELRDNLYDVEEADLYKSHVSKEMWEKRCNQFQKTVDFFNDPKKFEAMMMASESQTTPIIKDNGKELFDYMENMSKKTGIEAPVEKWRTQYKEKLPGVQAKIKEANQKAYEKWENQPGVKQMQAEAEKRYDMAKKEVNKARAYQASQQKEKNAPGGPSNTPAAPKKPKLFDRGILPAVGFGIGSLIGFLTGAIVMAVPLLIGGIISGVAKGVSHAVKRAAYRNEMKAYEAKYGEKKAEQKEKEDAHKSEKDITKEKELEKTLGSTNPQSVKEQAKEQLSPEMAKLKEQRYAQTEKLNSLDLKNSDFEKTKEAFVNDLAKIMVLKTYELSAQKDGIKHDITPEKLESLSNLFENANEGFVRLKNSIKGPDDLERLKKMANSQDGGELINELNKHTPKKEEDKPEKTAVRQRAKTMEVQPSQLQNQVMQPPGRH